ncbi:MAG: cysteine peptidase family C39 domain-containing protein [Ignavibacteria bacterium]
MTYYHQQTKFTCGPASIRNCLLAFVYIYSEKKIRDYTNTSRDSGTNERKIFRALKKLGFSYKEFFNKSEQAFRQRIIYNLKKGNKIIILTDHEDHWISVVDYSNKKLEVIDPERTRIRIELTPKELGKWCLNFNKHSKTTYYYGIIIHKPKEA